MRGVLVILIAMALPSVLPATGQWTAYLERFWGTGYECGNFLDLKTGTTLDECKGACEANSACTGVEHEIDDGYCYLYPCPNPIPVPYEDGAGNFLGDTVWNSYALRTRTADRWVAYPALFWGTGNECGKHLEVVAGTTLNECKGACEANSACTGVEHETDSGTCYLYPCPSPIPVPYNDGAQDGPGHPVWSSYALT